MQLEFQHSQEYAGITLALGMTPSPIVEITGVLGTEGLVIGGELAIGHTRGISLNKYNAGIGFTRPDFNASIILYVNAIQLCSLITYYLFISNFLFHIFLR
jgi:voltage-dependent anion channel protein 2